MRRSRSRRHRSRKRKRKRSRSHSEKEVEVIFVVAYVLAVVAANWAIGALDPVPVGWGLYAPAAVLFVGLTFTLRDFAQERVGKVWVLGAMGVGVIFSFLLADPRVAFASGAAFAVSEFADYSIYTPLRERGRWLLGVGMSNTVGVILDSLIFLSLANLMEFLPGQIIGKMEVTLITVGVLWVIRSRRSLIKWA
jgi:uncharacterized PurR-regulated membrane protein YhhQ (DUF165 family)